MPENSRLSNHKSHRLIEVVEILSVIGSVGGSIASVVTQQIVFASIPLSLAVALNLVNRRQVNSIAQTNQSVVAQLLQENLETQAKFGTLTEQLAEVQQLTTGLDQGIQQHIQSLLNNQTVSVYPNRSEDRVEVEASTEQIVELQGLITDLSQRSSHLQHHTQLLRKGQTKISKIVGWLREIETCNQTIRSNPNSAHAYYSRGLSYQRLGVQDGAIEDYNQAIRLNSCYAEAYYARGVLSAALKDKKGAVKDLREAAELFFEEGNIINYQKARDLSKKFHELSLQSRTDTFEEVAVESLFA